MLNSEQLNTIMLDIAKAIGFEQLEFLPTIGSSKGDGTPHIEISYKFYDYVKSERGREFSRRSTHKEDELLYWISKDLTFHVAMYFELENRIEGQDTRRLLFKKQIELLSELKEDWGLLLEKEKKEILNKAPFDDLASIRASYFTELRSQGFPEHEISKLAYEKYPRST